MNQSYLRNHIVPQDLSLPDRFFGFTLPELGIVAAGVGISVLLLLSALPYMITVPLSVLIVLTSLAFALIKVEGEMYPVYLFRVLQFKLTPEVSFYAKRPGRLKVKRGESAQDWVAPRSIRDGIVETRYGSYCIVLECSSVNIDLLSVDEKIDRENGFRRFLEIPQYPFSIYSLATPPEMESYFKRIKQREAQEPNEQLRKMLSAYNDEVARLLQEGKVISRRILIVIPLERHIVEGRRGQRLDFPAIREELHSRALGLINELKRFGVHGKILNDEDLVWLYYMMYNRLKTRPFSLGGPSPLYIEKEDASAIS